MEQEKEKQLARLHILPRKEAIRTATEKKNGHEIF
jgi:hypothetical protein